jgi:uncharacterized protein with GYD domain
METYIILTRLTDHGAKTLKDEPERIKEVNSELDAMNIKVREQYAVLGEYDFITIVEAPDNQSVTRAAIRMGARGTVRVQTMPAIPIDKFIAGLKA